ncbi:hypothetical protein Sste5346_008554 [Sporothrix stenoceras]|uniref:Uncharacterized protein n=1 Tax=Sporothrix stenoceras TaxID=5173 RepID=A0ABR3YNM7_9PEZI
MQRYSIHELWDSAMDAARTATAAADNLVAATKGDKVANVTVGYTPYTRHKPEEKITKPLPGIDAHDIQRLRTARRAARISEEAAAAALRDRSAYTAVLYKIESFSVKNDDSISAQGAERRSADRLGR